MEPRKTLSDLSSAAVFDEDQQRRSLDEFQGDLASNPASPSLTSFNLHDLEEFTPSGLFSSRQEIKRDGSGTSMTLTGTHETSGLQDEAKELHTFSWPHDSNAEPTRDEVYMASRKGGQGTHGHQDHERARQAQQIKWSGSSDRVGQQASLVRFLHEQDENGVLKFWEDESIAPHGIAGFEVKDLETFKSLRIKWFQREDINDKNSPISRDRAFDLDNSVNQAFRRNGLVPQRRASGRGFDWESGRLWSFDVETFRKDFMVDPVLVPESGMSYERTLIEQWLEHHSTDPKTGIELQSKLLIPNVALRDCIRAYLASLAAAASR